MNERQIGEMFRRERELWRGIQRDQEKLAEMKEEATAVGSLSGKDESGGSSGGDNRQERLIVRYVDFERELKKKTDEWMVLRIDLELLLFILPAEERDVIRAYYMDHKPMHECMEQLGISRVTFWRQHKRAMQKLQERLSVASESCCVKQDLE